MEPLTTKEKVIAFGAMAIIAFFATAALEERANKKPDESENSNDDN